MNFLELWAKITLDKKEYEEDLKKTEKDAKKTGNALSNAFKTSAKVVGGSAKTMVKSVEAIGVAAVKVGKVVAAGTAAAAGMAAKVGKAAFDAYANYEQLVGGVETLFKDSSNIVQENASKAFQTAGMSANEYMDLVTSFSASLLQSVGGDTEKAAKIADQAIIDMSDNANKMGTDISAIQTAYQGFAKQNYTMLDNLKLGYGGTKTEMERLIKDAEKLDKSFKASRDKNKELTMSYADIVQAIHIVQDNLDITGTTAREASTTIAGSISSMKAAWQNLLVGISDDTQPFDQLVDTFVGTVDVVGTNVIPRVEKIIDGIASLIEKLLPKLIERIPSLIEKTGPKLWSALQALGGTVSNALMSLLQMAANFLAQNAGTIFTSLMQVVTKLVKMLPQILQPIIKALPKIIKDVLNALKDNLPMIIAGLTDVIVMLAQAAPDIIMAIVDVLPDLINQVMDALIANLPIVIDALVRMVGEIIVHLPEIIKALLAYIPKLIEMILVGFGSLAGSILSIFEDIDLTEVIGGIIDSVGEIFSTIGDVLAEPFETIKDFFSGVWEWVEKVMDWIWDKVSGVFQDIYDFLDWINPFSDSKEEREAKKKGAQHLINIAQSLQSNLDQYAKDQEFVQQYGTWGSTTEVKGTVRIEGVNNAGEFVAAADYTADELAKKMNRDSRLYSYGG